ncbi:helix-hairpin-helix domain-containing protein [Vicingaceae bacterium]|nr:helix-hairpin-helix domain-containing protein [Vicingaceae bacterium]
MSKDQLKEVYGLKEETLIRLDSQLVFVPTKIRTLNINSATKEELKAHPYLYWKHANAIVNYRKQHWDYKTLDELKKIVLINDSIFQKVKPYLEL